MLRPLRSHYPLTNSDSRAAHVLNAILTPTVPTSSTVSPIIDILWVQPAGAPKPIDFVPLFVALGVDYSENTKNRRSKQLSISTSFKNTLQESGRSINKGKSVQFRNSPFDSSNPFLLRPTKETIPTNVSRAATVHAGSTTVPTNVSGATTVTKVSEVETVTNISGTATVTNISGVATIHRNVSDAKIILAPIPPILQSTPKHRKRKFPSDVNAEVIIPSSSKQLKLSGEAQPAPAVEYKRGMPLYKEHEVNRYDIGLFPNKRLAFEELYEVLERRWIPGNDFTYPVTMEGNGETKRRKRFIHMWLQQYNWLAYSKFHDGAFCYPCMFFGQYRAQ